MSVGVGVIECGWLSGMSKDENEGGYGGELEKFGY